MHKGFSSKVTEELYNYVITQDLRGEQIWCCILLHDGLLPKTL